MNYSNILLFTDLDGTLLNKDSFDYTDASIFLRRLGIVLPLVLQTQQCQGLCPFLFSVKLISILGLWCLQKGQ